MSIEGDIVRFLRIHLGTSREVPIARIALRHAAAAAKGQDVESFSIPEEGFTVESLALYAQEILSRAQTDADGLGGVQRYVIQAYDVAKTSVGRYAFRLRGQEDENDDSMSGEEAPTMRGLLQQLMRHNEANARTMNLMFQSNVSSLVRRIESQDRLIEGLVEQRHKDLSIIEEAKSQQHERDMQLLLTENAENRKDKLVEKLALMMPVALNHLVGKKVLDGDDPNVLMLKAFAGSLSPEQLQSIQAGLSVEQRVVLFKIIQGLQTTKELPGNGEPT